MIDISALRERNTKDAYTVTELNNFIKNLLESDRTLSAVSVSGEISNLTDHRSGHIYFSLKDSDSQIKAVMFRSQRSRLKFILENGMKVNVRGSVSMYSQGGSVQLYVNSIEPDGLGSLYKAYEQLKQKLYEEGLFDTEHKKPLPQYPEKIGVITSPSGAAVRDIINVAGRRYPLASIYVYPALVQGVGAEEDLIKALDYFDTSGLVDVIIIGRGGGSIEDLWAFNSEKLARRIYKCNVPVISAVGHETDFTICDFVADLRAPTPSAAAEIAVPDMKDMSIYLDDAYIRIENSLIRMIERKRERLDMICDNILFRDEKVLFEKYSSDVSDIKQKINFEIQKFVSQKSNDLKIIAAKANTLSPLSVLSRGFSVTESGGKIIKSTTDVKKGDDLKIVLLDGELNAKVSSVMPTKKRKEP